MRARRHEMMVVMVCLLVLAVEGMWFRSRVADPLEGWLMRDRQDELMTHAPRMNRRTAEIGSWGEMIDALGVSKVSAGVRQAASAGPSVARRVKEAYRGLVMPLTQEQRNRLLRPLDDLVDPLFPGIEGDSQRVFFYCLAALKTRADGAPPSEPSSERPGEDVVATLQIMPEALFWRLARLARSSDSPLAPSACAAVLERIDVLNAAVYEYEELRLRLWDAAGLPTRPEDRDHPPPFPFPGPEEVQRVEAWLSAMVRP